MQLTYLTKEEKVEIFKTFGNSEINTGSTEGQVAILTKRINHLTEHLKKNRKDFVTQRALINMVSRRRRHLNYLKNNQINVYRELIKKLGIRK